MNTTQRLMRAGLVGAVAGALVAGSALTVGAQGSTTWNWSGQLGEGRTVYLRNINGEVRIEQGTGNTVEVRAEKRWRRGDPDDVRIEARTAGSGSGDVLICALFTERATCDENGYRGNNDRDNWKKNNDVSVSFVVKVPRNARVDASTVNGGLVVEGTSGEIRAHTVNGDLEARSTSGRVEANTVNGNITVRTAVPAGERRGVWNRERLDHDRARSQHRGRSGPLYGEWADLVGFPDDARGDDQPAADPRDHRRRWPDHPCEDREREHPDQETLIR